MPTIDLGSVVGPQGEQGNTGAQGPQGVAGPSLISTTTQTTLNGVLAGDGSVVGVKSVDATPTNLSTNLVQSGGVYDMIKTDDAYLKSTTVNPNLLDNWYFVGGGSQQGGGQFPINQRGTTTGSTTNAVYFIDRWLTTYGSAVGTWALTSSGLKITPSGSSVTAIYQAIDDTNLNGKTVTASALLSDGTLITGTVVRSSGTAQDISSDSKLRFWGTPSKFRFQTTTEVTVVALKLEIGSTQTLCHNEGTDANPTWVLNEVPNYQQELAKCQRYFYSIDNYSNVPIVGSGCVTISPTNAAIFFPTPVSMRKAAPTITFTGTVSLWHGSTIGSSAPAVTAITDASLSPSGVAATVKVASGLATGESCFVQLRDSNAKITISCDL